MADGSETAGGGGERGVGRAGRPGQVGAESDIGEGHAEVKISGAGRASGISVGEPLDIRISNLCAA